MFELASLVPEGLSQFWFIAFIALSFFTSMLTAAVGIGGGTIMLAALAQMLPAAAIVPVHGIVQLGSNTGRALIMLKDVQRPYLLYFFLGCIGGAFIGGKVVVSLPADILRLILGCFILFTVGVGGVMPQKTFNKASFAVGGCVTAVLTMFVGATGPLVVAMVNRLALSPKAIVATTSACLVIQHSLKIAAFGFLGFVFTPYIPMIAAMIFTGFIGTVLGKRILVRTPPRYFKRLLDLLITLLALRLIYVALINLYA